MKKFKPFFLLFLAVFATTMSYAQGVNLAQTQLFLQLDDRPDEISWEITNSGFSLRSGGPYSLGNANKLIAINLDTGVFGPGASFTFTIKDSGNNGLNGGAWAINSNNLTPATSASGVGERIINGVPDFGSEYSVTFINTDRTTIPSGPNSIGNVSASDFSNVTTGGGSGGGGGTAQGAGLDNFVPINIQPGRVRLDFSAENAGRARLRIVTVNGNRTIVNRVVRVNEGSNSFTISRRKGTRVVAILSDLNSQKILRTSSFRF